MPTLTSPTGPTIESRAPGRPRSEKARKAVIQSTLALLKQVGFHELTIEAVAARAGVGKTTVYRWWSNKAELVVDCFVSAVEEELRFPTAGPVLVSIREQMRRWVPIFRSPLGQIVATVIGAGQSDPEILKAFRTHWVEPRRVEARRLLRLAMKNGEIRRGPFLSNSLCVFSTMGRPPMPEPRIIPARSGSSRAISIPESFQACNPAAIP